MCYFSEYDEVARRNGYSADILTQIFTLKDVEKFLYSLGVNEIDVQKRPGKAKKIIGYMPEGVPLYGELTVKEFIKYLKKPIDTTILMIDATNINIANNNEIVIPTAPKVVENIVEENADK